MSLIQVVPPTVLVVSLAEAKVHLRVDHTDEDALITAMIKSATEQCEHETGVALMAQTWERALDAFPEAEIELGVPPVQAVVSVKYTDTAGAEQTIQSANYTLDAATPRGWLLPADGYSWPATAEGANVVRVRFVAGAADVSAVPESLKSWVLMQVGALYRNREAFAIGVQTSALPNRFAAGLLDRHRVWVL